MPNDLMPHGGLLFRSAAIRPNSFNRETRTFTAVLATSSPLQRRGGYEVLDLESIVLPASAPILLDHRATVDATVGRAENIRREGDAIVGDCRISSDPALASLCERIADGTVDGVSIGYSVPRWNETRAPSGERTRTAVGAVLRHAALVAEPADSRAGIRSNDDDDDDRRSSGNAGGNAHIRALCRSLGLSRDMEDRAIDEQWDDDAIMRTVRSRSRIDVSTTGSFDDPAFHRTAMVDSLVTRMIGSEPQGAARELAALSWPELHRRHLRAAGHSVAGLSDTEVITRALSTSDMPIIAGTAVNVVIRRTYDASVSPIAAMFGMRDLPDFRPVEVALVDWTTLGIGKVGELGEFKSSYVTESGERISLYTIGGITGVSRQLWINGAAALGNLSTAQGRRLAADVSDRMVAYLVQNNGAGPNMKDGDPVFSAAPGGRGNVLPLDTTDVTTVIDGVLAARAAASKRQGAGSVMIGVAPTVWVVEPTFEPMAIRALAQVAAAEAANVNPLAGKLSILSEPRLADPDVSYLVAPPSAMDGAVRVSLSGQPGPQTEGRWGFEVDAVQYKIRLDFGLGWLEWRSWTRLDHAAA
jgi:hypothetical protein